MDEKWFAHIENDKKAYERVRNAIENDEDIEDFVLGVMRFSKYVDRVPSDRRQDPELRKAIVKFTTKILTAPDAERKRKAELFKQHFRKIRFRMAHMYPDVKFDQLFDEQGNRLPTYRRPQIMDPIRRKAGLLPHPLNYYAQRECILYPDEDDDRDIVEVNANGMEMEEEAEEMEVDDEEEEDAIDEQFSKPLKDGKVERRLPESEELYLPRDGLTDFREWNEKDVVIWTKKFITNPTHIKLMKSRKYDGKQLLDELYENGWDRESLPFGLYVQLKTKLNRVINHHFGFVYSKE